MRDLSNHEKNEVGKLTKQIEKQNNDFNNILKDKERLETEVAQLQEQTIDLQEQVCDIIIIIVLAKLVSVVQYNNKI